MFDFKNLQMTKYQNLETLKLEMIDDLKKFITLLKDTAFSLDRQNLQVNLI